MSEYRCAKVLEATRGTGFYMQRVSGVLVIKADSYDKAFKKYLKLKKAELKKGDIVDIFRLRPDMPFFNKSYHYKV